MPTVIASLLAACLLLFPAPSAAQDLTLDQILEKNLEALGGEEAVKSIKTLVINMKMVMGGGVMEAPMTVQIKRPNKFRTELTFQGRQIVSAYDGTVAWTINPMQGPEPQKLEGRMLTGLANAADDANTGALLLMKRGGSTVELVGKEDAEGSPTYKIKVTRKSGDVSTHFLDAEKFLTIKTIMKTPQMGQEIEVESLPSNYKKVSGVLMAHSVENRVAGTTRMSMTIEKVEVNQPLEDAIFAWPDKPAEKPAEKK